MALISPCWGRESLSHCASLEKLASPGRHMHTQTSVTHATSQTRYVASYLYCPLFRLMSLKILELSYPRRETRVDEKSYYTQTTEISQSLQICYN